MCQFRLCGFRIICVLEIVSKHINTALKAPHYFQPSFAFFTFQRMCVCVWGVGVGGGAHDVKKHQLPVVFVGGCKHGPTSPVSQRSTFSWVIMHARLLHWRLGSV